MAKTIAKKTVQKPEKEKVPLIPEKYQDWVFIGLLVISVFIFFASAISSGGFKEVDTLASMSFKNYLAEASKTGKFPLWVPYIFSGMPSYAALLTTGERTWDIIPLIMFGITKFIGNVFNNDVARMSTFYSIYAIGIYLLMKAKKHERFVAFFSAFAAVFSTWVITWVMIGHNTKPVVFAMFPFILLFTEKLREKFSFIYMVLLIFALHIMLEGGHLQLIFYGVCAMGLYLVYELVARLIRKDEPMKLVRAAALLGGAAVIAFLMSSDRYLATLEYTPHSTRGSAPIMKTEQMHQNASGGHDYEYATMWSYAPSELITTFVPSYYGFGIRDFDYQGQKMKLSSYWGQKESEDSPPYMGIAVIFLAILGFIAFRKDVFVQFLLALIIFGVLLSFGKNWSILYNVFYYYIPSFSKFRAPSMSLVMMHLAVPLLAGYGIAAVLKWRKEMTEKDKKLMLYFLGGIAAFMVIGLLFSAAFKSSYTSAVMSSRLGQAYSQNFPTELMDFIWENMVEDWLLNGLFALIMGLSVYLFALKKINKNMMFAILAIILVVDLWRVDYRRMEVTDEKTEGNVFENKADVFNFIKQDKGVFRIADFASNPANIPAYFLVENINGYHSAKLRVAQDLMDVANPDEMKGSTHIIYNPFLWNLLNVKYVLSEKPLYQGIQPLYTSQTGGTLVYANPGYLPRAFFVKGVKQAKQIDILMHLKNGDFNPLETAFLEKPINDKIDPADSLCTAKIVNKENEFIRMEVNATGYNLLFISEMYYPSWHAYIDGKEVPIIKTNYAFRSVIVPPGKHALEMKFISENFETGKKLSIAANILAFALLAAGLVLEWMRRKKNKEV